jgi:hypothetical protein
VILQPLEAKSYKKLTFAHNASINEKIIEAPGTQYNRTPTNRKPTLRALATNPRQVRTHSFTPGTVRAHTLFKPKTDRFFTIRGNEMIL